MPSSVFLLGPDEWDDGHHPEAPAWLANEVTDFGPKGYQPRHLRLYLQQVLERCGQPAVVMQRDLQQKGEADGTFFHRLEKENRVERYIIIVPPRCKVLGTVFEGGMLERDFHYGRNPVIVCLFHSEFAGPESHDRVTFTEKGKRTHYLESLAQRAHHVGFWDEPEELIDAVVAWGTLAA